MYKFFNNNLIANSVSGTCNYFVNIIVMFVMSPILINALGNNEYGIWELVMGLIGYMGLLDLGIGAALLRNVAIAYENKDRKELCKIISSAQIFFILIAVFASLAFAVFAFNPGIVFGIEGNKTEYLQMVVILFTINCMVFFPLTVLTAVIMGTQKHYYINITRIFFSIVRAVMAYYFLVNYSGKGLLILAFLELCSNLLQYIVYAMLLKLDSLIPSFHFSECSFAKLRELFSYGSKSATLMIASRIQSSSIPFVISTVVGLGSIVYFTMPNRLIDYAKGLSLAIGFPLTPYFASQMTNDDQDIVRNSWIQTSLALQIITTAMPLFILFCGEPFLSIWIGKEYGIAGRGVLYCLVIALFVESVAPNASRILMASGHHGRAAVMWLVLAVLSIPLTILGASRWGVTGVALGSSAAIIVGNIIMLRMACHDVGVSFSEYLQRTFMRLVVPLLLLTLFLWLFGMVLVSENYLNLVLQVCFSGFLYLVAVWFLTLNADVRTRIFTQISARFRKPDASLT